MQKLENWNGNSIRFVEHNGEWWAVLSDITRALNLRTDKVRSRLEDDHLSRVGIKDRMGLISALQIPFTADNKKG